jgi:hypothetical protein
VRNRNRTLISMVASGIFSFSHAQTTAPGIAVSTVEIDIVVDGKPTKSQGLLYRANPVTDALMEPPIAQVKEDGTITPLYSCRKDDKLLARPENILTVTVEKPKDCANKLTFVYTTVGLDASDGELQRAAKLASNGQYTEANKIFFVVSSKAAAKEQTNTVKTAEAGVAVTTALIIGGKEWRKYVAFDPQNDYAATLSESGTIELEKFQTNAKIPATGVVDYETAKLIANKKQSPTTSQAIDSKLFMDLQ